MNQLITTSDGSHTIFVPELNEHYHSVHGAVQESEFIFIKAGYDFCTSNPMAIFEVGFGTGLNALLTAVKSCGGEREINYTSIEKYPVDKDLVSTINHHLYAGKAGKEIYDSIHSSPWNSWVNICKNFNLRKISGDIITDPVPGKLFIVIYSLLVYMSYYTTYLDLAF